EVAQGLQLVFRCGFLAHRDCVGVLESERREPPHSPASIEFARDVRINLKRITCDAVGKGILENRNQSCPGVLGIDVDRIRSHCTECNFSCTESKAPGHRDSPRFQYLSKHLGQDVRLSEWFRCNYYGTRRRSLCAESGCSENPQKNSFHV